MTLNNRNKWKRAFCLVYVDVLDVVKWKQMSSIQTPKWKS